MHFSIQKKPLPKDQLVIAAMGISLVGVVTIYYWSDFNSKYTLPSILFLVAVLAITTLIKVHGMKSFKEFDTTDEGISVKNKIHPWSEIKYYSWYGEKQSEHVGRGSVFPTQYGGIDPVLSNGGSILELNFGALRRTLKLKIDSSQINDILSLLQEKGIKHISTARLIIGY